MGADSANIVYGRNPVTEALKSGRTVDKIYVQRGERTGSLIALIAMAKDKRIPVIEADKQKLEVMCGDSQHQGVVALITYFVYSEPSDMLELAEQRG